MIFVCGLSNLDEVIAAHKPSHVLSLLGPDQMIAPLAGFDARHGRIAIHDIPQPMEGYTHPGEQHARTIVEFAEDWGGEEAPIVIHCLAGISRSTAAAFATLCMYNEPGLERDIARDMRRRGPHVQPNPLITKHVDDLLGRGGRMVAAVEELGWGTGMNDSPWLELPLRYTAAK